MAERAREDHVTATGDSLIDAVRDMVVLPGLAQAILRRRMSPLAPEDTLAALGEEYGVTRERVRQVQVKLEKAVAGVADDSHVLEVAGNFRDHFGLAVELGGVTPPFLATPLTTQGWSADEAVAVSLIASGWSRAGSWCLHPHIPALPDRADVDQKQRLVAHLGALLGAGLAEQVVAGAVRDRNRPHADIGDLCELVLAGSHRALTPEELAAHDSGGRSSRYIENVLASDDRFVRLSRDAYGLASWELPPYVGVADAMLRSIDAGGGRSRLTDLARDLHAQYAHSPSSVQIYATSALVFEVSDGWVRRRPPERYAEFAVPPEEDDRCWQNELGQWSVSIPVGHNLLRGSGLALPRGFLNVLGCPPGGSIEVTDDAGQVLQASWSERATGGPSIGSLRGVAERLSAKDGQNLVLSWDSAAGVLRVGLEPGG